MQRRDLLRITAVLGLLLAVVVVLVPPAGATGGAVAGRGARPCTQVELVAHRGLHNKRHTEDTLAAFANAINRGVGVIDGDLRLSGDGSWVFLHDPTIGRTTHGRGSVHQSDAYLASVRNNDGRIGLTFLPSALQLLAAHLGVRFEIEVKPADAPVDRLRLLVSLLSGYGVMPRVVLTSRSTAVLDRLRQIAPGLQTGLITRDPNITPATARAYGSTVILGAFASRPPLVAALRSAGLRVETWTVDRRRQYRRAVRSRSNAVITDRLVDVRTWCRRR